MWRTTPMRSRVSRFRYTEAMSDAGTPPSPAAISSARNGRPARARASSTSRRALVRRRPPRRTASVAEPRSATDSGTARFGVVTSRPTYPSCDRVARAKRVLAGESPADELGQAAHEAPHALIAALPERRHHLVLVEHHRSTAGSGEALKRAQGSRARARRGEQRNATARRQQAGHAVERGHRVGQQVEGREAADGVEGALAEDRLGDVPTDVGDLAV